MCQGSLLSLGVGHVDPNLAKWNSESACLCECSTLAGREQGAYGTGAAEHRWDAGTARRKPHTPSPGKATDGLTYLNVRDSTVDMSCPEGLKYLSKRESDTGRSSLSRACEESPAAPANQLKRKYPLFIRTVSFRSSKGAPESS